MLQHADAIIRKDCHITTSLQAAPCISKWRVSHIIHNFGYLKVCARWIPLSLTFKHKPCKRPILPSFWHVLKHRDKTTYHGLLQHMKLAPSFWIGDKKALHRKAQNLKSPSADKSMITVCEDCEGLILYCGCHAEWETINSNMYTRNQSSGSVSNEFGITRIQQKSCFSMMLQGRIQVWQLGKPHYKIWLDSVNPSTLHPRSSNFWFPPIWSPDGCNPWYKFEIDKDVIQIVITWLCEQHNDMVLTGIHTLIPYWHKAIAVDWDFVETQDMESNHQFS
jgi:hypothetical protein